MPYAYPVAVTARDAHWVEVVYSDGSRLSLDLAPYLKGPIFEPIVQDDALFRQVAVDPVFHSLQWPNGADVPPEILRPSPVPR